MNILTVREIQQSDIPKITYYWVNSKPDFLVHMGVDLSKIPTPESLSSILAEQLVQDYDKKGAYCMIWLLNDEPIGHSNVNKINFGKDASMHLHLWDANFRDRGYGVDFVKMSLPYFFDNLQLENIYSEPHAQNLSPNKTLEKVGFTLVDTYITMPGWINYDQPVNRWEMSREVFERTIKYGALQKTVIDA